MLNNLFNRKEKETEVGREGRVLPGQCLTRKFQ